MTPSQLEFNKGHRAFIEDDIELAINHFRLAVSLDSENAQAKTFLGVALTSSESIADRKEAAVIFRTLALRCRSVSDPSWRYSDEDPFFHAALCELEDGDRFVGGFVLALDLVARIGHNDSLIRRAALGAIELAEPEQRAFALHAIRVLVDASRTGTE